ncbi:MAG: exodeoxyribonuclease VII small subunit [Eubacteriales bacterium]|nr:exodeoxyribonuclease VII small subunit [Eubacteriales bacterium]
MTAKKKSMEPTFEDELARLEVLAEQMEQGELPLDELMAAYEEGAKLVKALQEKLNRAKARLHEVKADPDGGLTVTLLKADEPDA